jgi:hypothetical protein
MLSLIMLQIYQTEKIHLTLFLANVDINFDNWAQFHQDIYAQLLHS